MQNEILMKIMFVAPIILLGCSAVTCSLIKKNYLAVLNNIVEKKCKDSNNGCTQLDKLMGLKAKIVVLMFFLILMFIVLMFKIFNSEVYTIIIIIVSGSLLGVASKIFQNYDSDIIGTIKCIFTSLCSGAMLPLFLNIIQSNLLETILKKGTVGDRYQAMLTLFAFSVLSSIFADKIIKILGDKYISQLSETDKKIKELEKDFQGKSEQFKNTIKEKDLLIKGLMKSIPAQQNEEFGEGGNIDIVEPNYKLAKEILPKGGQ